MQPCRSSTVATPTIGACARSAWRPLKRRSTRARTTRRTCSLVGILGPEAMICYCPTSAATSTTRRACSSGYGNRRNAQGQRVKRATGRLLRARRAPCAATQLASSRPFPTIWWGRTSIRSIKSECPSCGTSSLR